VIARAAICAYVLAVGPQPSSSVPASPVHLLSLAWLSGRQRRPVVRRWLRRGLFVLLA